MMCGGKTKCAIYRDKKFCSKFSERSRNGICECRHARLTCEAEHCVLQPDCHIYAERMKMRLKKTEK